MENQARTPFPTKPTNRYHIVRRDFPRTSTSFRAAIGEHDRRQENAQDQGYRTQRAHPNSPLLSQWRPSPRASASPSCEPSGRLAHWAFGPKLTAGSIGSSAAGAGWFGAVKEGSEGCRVPGVAVVDTAWADLVKVHPDGFVDASVRLPKNTYTHKTQINGVALSGSSHWIRSASQRKGIA